LYQALDPALVVADTTQLKSGYNRIELAGHYTHFKDAQTTAGIRVGEYYFQGDVQPSDNGKIAITLDLPDTLPSNAILFKAYNSIDGELILNQACSLGNIVLDTASADSSWVKNVKLEKYVGSSFPNLPILNETIRNLMWHVPMWFTMFFIMILSFSNSLKLLNLKESPNRLENMLKLDMRSTLLNEVGVLFCVLGLLTGSLWARYTWGDWWTNDPQLNGALVVFLVYSGYFILRASIDDEDKRARISAVFNIFAFVLMFILLMIMPRFAAGLHPGKSGNPAFSQYDLDSTLRAVFYPAVFGWICLGYWLYSVRIRAKRIKEELKLTED
jgi:heme exporter protein C